MKLPLDALLFWGETVGVTGSGPHDEAVIEKIATLEGAIVGDMDIWQTNQLLVVGREDFDEEYLERSIDFGLEHGFTCRYLSQEDFWAYWLGGDEPTYFAGDPRIEDHEGLSFLASVGFKWPSIEVVQRYGGTGELAGRVREQHELKKIFGYSVRQGVSVDERRQRLKRATRKPPSGLGLKMVALHIAGMINLALSRNDARMNDAISNWEADLEWLRRKYYENRRHSFIWPSTD